MTQNLSPSPLAELKTEILQAIEKQHALAHAQLLKALDSERVKMQEWLVQWAMPSIALQSVQTGQEVDLQDNDMDSFSPDLQENPGSSRPGPRFQPANSDETKNVSMETRRNSFYPQRSIMAQKVFAESLLKDLDLEDIWRPDSFASSYGLSSAIRHPENWLARLIRSNIFVYIVWTLILANTIFIGVETNANALRAWDNPNAQSSRTFRFVNMCFTIAFSLELTMRIGGLRCWFLFGDEWKWNLFDLLLVISALIQEVLETASNVSFIRVLRVFRVIRMMRIVRVLRMFNELRRMVMAIGSSMISLLWAFLLLLILTYVFSLFIMQGATSYVQDHGANDATAIELRGMVGDIFKSTITVLQSISGGRDWGEVSSALGKQSKLYEVACVGFVVFTAFGVLNVLTGVFVANSAEILDRDLLIQQELFERKTFAQEMKRIFDELDPTGSGIVTWTEFEKFMSSSRLQAYLEAHQLDTTDARLLFELMDRAGDESIRTADFIAGCVKLRGPATVVHVKKMNAEMTATLDAICEMVQNVSAEVSRVRIPDAGRVSRIIDANASFHCSDAKFSMARLSGYAGSHPENSKMVSGVIHAPRGKPNTDTPQHDSGRKKEEQSKSLVFL